MSSGEVSVHMACAIEHCVVERAPARPIDKRTPDLDVRPPNVVSGRGRQFDRLLEEFICAWPGTCDELHRRKKPQNVDSQGEVVLRLSQRFLAQTSRVEQITRGLRQPEECLCADRTFGRGLD